MNKISIDEVVDIAFMVDKNSPIDWGNLRNGKEQAIRMVASSVIEQFEIDDFSEDHKLIMIATITKLLVENMILYSKLLDQQNN